MDRQDSNTNVGHRVLGLWNTAAVILASIAGGLASLMLLQTELEHLRNPSAALSCDVNILIGCGSSLSSPEAHLLGAPNSALGLALFSAMAVVGVLIAARVNLPRWVCLAMGGASVGGLAFIGYFLFLSVTQFHSLCPFCLVVWSSVVVLAGILIPHALSLIDQTSYAGRLLERHSWAVIVSLHLIVIIIVVLTMSDKIGGL